MHDRRCRAAVMRHISHSITALLKRLEDEAAAESPPAGLEVRLAATQAARKGRPDLAMRLEAARDRRDAA